MKNNNVTSQHFTSSQKQVVFVLVVAYSSCMFCKVTLPIAVPAMVAHPLENHLGVDDAAMALGIGSAAVVFAKLASGYFADKWGGKQSLVFVMSACSLFLYIGSVCTKPLPFALSWFGSMFCVGSGWTCLTKVVSGWFSEEQLGKVFGILGTSSRFGALLGNVLLGYLLFQGMKWRTLFILSAVWILFAALGVAILLQSQPFVEKHKNTKMKIIGSSSTPIDTIRYHSHNPSFWYMIFSLSFLTCLMEITNFLPLFFHVNYALDKGAAGIISGIFPFGCVVMLIIGGLIYDNTSPRAHTIWFTFSVSIATLALGLLSTSKNVLVGIITCLVSGVGLAPAFYIPPSIYPISAAGPANCGMLSGILSAIANFCAIAFNLIAGSLLTRSPNEENHNISIVTAQFNSEGFCVLLLGLGVLSTIFVWLFHSTWRQTHLNHEADADASPSKIRIV